VLLLTFHVGDERYALPCRAVVEVAPRVRMRALPRAPAFVAGLMSYRGSTVPVIDLGVLFVGRACAERMSTRVLVLEPSGSGLVGVIAERVSELITVAEGDLERSPIRLADAEYLGAVFRDRGVITQLVDVQHLLPTRLRELLRTDEGAR
jgi:chemotaxis-related protein WspB